MSEEKQIILTESEYLALKRPNRPQRARQPFTKIDGEGWKKVNVNNGIYHASDKGRICKLYKDQSGRIHHTLLRLRPLNGSMGVNLTVAPGDTRGFQAGRVILLTWKPDEDPKHVGYKDGDFTNLNLSNLFWASKKELKDHYNKIGKRRRKLTEKKYKTAYGKIRSKMVLFSDKEKEEMKNMYAQGMTQTAIAEKFEATQAYVSKIIRDKA